MQKTISEIGGTILERVGGPSDQWGSGMQWIWSLGKLLLGTPAARSVEIPDNPSAADFADAIVTVVTPDHFSDRYDKRDFEKGLEALRTADFNQPMYAPMTP